MEKDLKYNDCGIYEASKIINIIKRYKNHYDNYARPYQDMAIKTHKMIHGDIDWSHKSDLEAKIHLNKLGLAQDNWKATLKQGLMNFDEWLEVIVEPMMESEYMDNTEAKRMVSLLLRDENFKVKFSDCLGIGFVENFCTMKIMTEVKEISGPKGKKYKSPRTTLVPLDIFSMAVDPSSVDLQDEKPLYKIQTIEYPKYLLMKMASDDPKDNKPFIKKVVKRLQGTVNQDKNRQEEAQGKEILSNTLPHLKNILVWEFYGTIIDDDGDIMMYYPKEGEPFLLEDVRIYVGDGLEILAEPQKMDVIAIDGKDCYVHHKIIRNNKDLLGRSIGHSGYSLNKMLNEYTCALADSGMKVGSNVTLFKPDLLLDPEAGADGFSYNDNIAVMADANLNEIFKTVQIGELNQTMFNVYNILSETFAENVSKNSTALSGAFTGKQVRATEAAQAGNTVAALDESLLIDIDDIMMEGAACKIFRQGLNLASFFNDQDLLYIFANQDKALEAERIEKFKELRKNKKKLFEELGYTFRFRGRGLRGITNRARMGQMTMNLLSSVLGNPMMIEILERNDWDMAAMLDHGVKGMGVDPKELKNKKVGEMARERQNYRELGRGIADAQGGQQQQADPGAQNPTQATTGDTMPGNTGE